MKVKKGQNRIVFLIPEIDIAIKIPIIYFRKTISLFLNNIKNRSWDKMKRELSWSSDVGLMGFRRYLFKGILDNWREFYFYVKNRSPVLQTTYFSLFGFFNIQKLGHLLDMDANSLYCQLCVITDGLASKDIHHFDNPDNFCSEEGKLKIVDYGAPKTQEVVVKYGAKILNEFDLSYDWEEEKQKKTP